MKKKKDSASIIYLCRFAIRFRRESLNFQSLVITPTLLEVLPFDIRFGCEIRGFRYTPYNGLTDY